jgi:hypothetical protein
MGRKTTGRSDLVDIECEIRAERPLAVLIHDGQRTVWLPRSQIEIGDDGTIAMPEWLAMEKGLI